MTTQIKGGFPKLQICNDVFREQIEPTREQYAVEGKISSLSEIMKKKKNSIFSQIINSRNEKPKCCSEKLNMVGGTRINGIDLNVIMGK